MRTDRLQTAFWFLVVIFAIVFLWHDIVRGIEPFDHSRCQYPLRVSNPPDGCDNSDPCDPLDAAKGGTGLCPEKVQTPTVKENVAPAAPEAVVSEPEPEITPVEPDFVGK